MRYVLFVIFMMFSVSSYASICDGVANDHLFFNASLSINSQSDKSGGASMTWFVH